MPPSWIVTGCLTGRGLVQRRDRSWGWGEKITPAGKDCEITERPLISSAWPPFRNVQAANENQFCFYWKPKIYFRQKHWHMCICQVCAKQKSIEQASMRVFFLPLPLPPCPFSPLNPYSLGKYLRTPILQSHWIQEFRWWPNTKMCTRTPKINLHCRLPISGQIGICTHGLQISDTAP